MNKRVGILFFLLALGIDLSGQINPYGLPEVVNYPPEVTNGEEQNWAIVEDNRGVMYFGNDVKGVLEYDGNEWRTIPVPNNSIVRSLACSEDGTVYVGAVSEIGYLAPNSIGLLEYQSLLPLLDTMHLRFSDVWKTYCVDNKVFFHSEKQLFIYYPDKDSINVLFNDRHALFGFHENGNLYVGIFSKGLCVFQGDTLQVTAKGGDFYKQKDIFGLTSYDENHLLIGVTGSGLSLYNTETGEVDSLFAAKATNKFLNDNFLTSLIGLANGDFIATTYNRGLAYIDRKGQIAEQISKDEGLQDQVIYSAYQSKNGFPRSQIWTAMSLGISKISFESPLRKYSETSGAEGLIHVINSIDDRIYIGTSNGLFALRKIENVLSFEKIENITRQIWDLEKFTLNTGENVLLAIGEEGLFQIHKNGKTLNLKDQVKGIQDEYERIFWGYTIFRDPYKDNRIILGMESSITYLSYEQGNWVQEVTLDSIDGETRTIGISKSGTLYIGKKLAGISSLNPLDGSKEITTYGTESGLPSKNENYIYQYGEEILLGTLDGIYRINDKNDSVYFYKDTVLNQYLPKGKNAVLFIYRDPSDALWISFKNEFRGWSIALLEALEDGTFQVTDKPFLILGNFSTDVFFSLDKHSVWFSKSDNLYHYEKSKAYNESKYSALIRKVTVDESSVIYQGAYPILDKNGKYKLALTQNKESIPELKYSENNIEFRWSAPFFDEEESIEFSFYLEGFSKTWSNWSQVFYQDFTNLPHGSYTFKVKAKNIYQEESLTDNFSFVILRPWYLTFVAFLLYIIAVIFIVYIIIALYTKRLKNENIRLEGIIQERTTEIRKQKEELTDSIEYASRIQRALLPPDHMLTQHKLEHFILFKPRDIVSGDFYWFGTNEEKIFIVAADCTGHGVPGAFMSMLGISFLDEIVIKSGVSDTNLVLDALRNHVITSLRQSGSSMEESTKDGMDLAMVAINKDLKSVQYSGAYNPLYVVRELNDEEKKILKAGEDLSVYRGTIHNDTHLLYQIKADLMPIGISEKDHEFSAHIIDDSGITIYLFSDGFVDQFGGPMGKKFMSRNFKKLLLDIQGLSMEKQRKKLDDSLADWMGNISQIDDILIIGIRLGG